MGRKPIGERAMTAAERQQRSRKILNDPIRHSEFARMLYALGYITDTDRATMFDMTERYDAAVARGHAIPRSGTGQRNFQLTDDYARALAKHNQKHPSRAGRTTPRGGG